MRASCSRPSLYILLFLSLIHILVFYHSCGYVLPFIGHLLDAGVDVLNPVQPECMDFAEVHARYGDRISFHGTIGTQTTMPFGTPDEVRRVVFTNLDIAGAKGGLLPAPTHLLEPEVPVENVIAVSYTHLDVYKRQVEHMKSAAVLSDKRGGAVCLDLYAGHALSAL